jgi:hypothetical protein
MEFPARNTRPKAAELPVITIQPGSGPLSHRRGAVQLFKLQEFGDACLPRRRPLR